MTVDIISSKSLEGSSQYDSLFHEPAAFAVDKVRIKVGISIIIVNFNGLDTIEECLSSVLKNLPEDGQVIVVDNASTDGSPELIASKFPDVELINNPLNGGFGQGNNLGVQHAKGEYLIFLNPDTLVTPGWIEPLIATLNASSNCGMVTPKILLMAEPDLINACGNDMHFTGITLCRGARKPASDYAKPEIVSAVSGAAFVIRRSAFDEIGGFDPLLFMYMDDTDLSFRIRQAGYTCVYVPDSVVYHDYSLTFGPRKTFFQERNRYVMLLKSWRWRTLLLLLPPLLVAEFITWGFVFAKERRHVRNKWNAYAEIYHIWDEIMDARRATQKLRRVNDSVMIAEMTYAMDFGQTGDDLVSRVANMVFNPTYKVMHRALRFLVRW